MASLFLYTQESSSQPPLCVYQQVVWVGTPTKYKCFAEVDVKVYKTSVVATIHFTKQKPSSLKQFKQPRDIAKVIADDPAKSAIQKYEEQAELIGQFESTIGYDSQLSNEKKEAFVTFNTVNEEKNVEQFPTVTVLKQTIYNVAGSVVQEKQLSRYGRDLLAMISSRLQIHFPNLRK